jgi:hypothetical protein
MIRIAVIILVISAYHSIYAGGLLFFPPPPKTLSAETMPFLPMLHTGAEGGDFYMRGRFGVDFPVAGYDLGGGGSDNPNVLFGITAASHINMLPADNMRFPVDNFYATLALHFSGTINPALSWRFYPIYHVSAHLADGYPGDILKSGVRPVSSEMIRGEAYCKLFGGVLELGAGAGWHYHVCAQKELRFRGDISALVTPNRIFGGILQPFALLRAEDVVQDGHNPGVEVSGGIFALKGRRGFGLSFRYFNHLHRSYYFEQYEKGWGAEYTFMY